MTRAETFVFVALAVGWLVSVAWTLRIARKVKRLDEPR